MTWQPTYPDVRFAPPLIENILSAIRTHGADALAWINNGPGLTNFQQVSSSPSAGHTNFPDVSVVTKNSDEDYTNEPEIHEDISVTLQLVVTGPKAEETTALSDKYVAAVKMIVLSMTDTEWRVNAPGLSGVKVLRMRSNYDFAAQANVVYDQRPMIEIILRAIEG